MKRTYSWLFAFFVAGMLWNLACGPVCDSGNGDTCGEEIGGHGGSAAAGSGGGGSGGNGSGGTGGVGGEGGVASLECEEPSDCYTFGLFCSGTHCAAPVLEGEQCDELRQSPVFEVDGPVIHSAELVALTGGAPNCIADICPNAMVQCGFRFRYFDPQDDVSAISLAEIVLTLPDGSRTTPASIFREGPDTLTFTACFSAGEFERAFALRDAAGHYSNSLCISGEAP